MTRTGHSLRTREPAGGSCARIWPAGTPAEKNLFSRFKESPRRAAVSPASETLRPTREGTTASRPWIASLIDMNAETSATAIIASAPRTRVKMRLMVVPCFNPRFYLGASADPAAQQNAGPPLGHNDELFLSRRSSRRASARVGTEHHEGNQREDDDAENNEDIVSAAAAVLRVGRWGRLGHAWLDAGWQRIVRPCYFRSISAIDLHILASPSFRAPLFSLPENMHRNRRICTCMHRHAAPNVLSN